MLIIWNLRICNAKRVCLEHAVVLSSGARGLGYFQWDVSLQSILYTLLEISALLLIMLALSLLHRLLYSQP